MTLVVVPMAMAMFIAAAVFTASKILNKRSMEDREKSSAFECGFDPKNNARVPFSMRFFMLAIIFIVFDIEIVLLMPIPLLPTMMNTTSSMFIGMMFLLILLLGLLYEWEEGSLDWSK